MRHAISMVAAGLLLVAANAGAKGYGPAGCGLGSLVFEPNSGFTQIFAATTNGTSGSQTFGISSGTSNCDGGSGSAQGTKVFVATNRGAVARDIARGRGETISSLSQLAGCRDPNAVGQKLQTSFKVIFPSAAVSDDAVGQSVVNVLKSDTSLSCTNLT